MLKVGLVGWRGMVGSVLMQRIVGGKRLCPHRSGVFHHLQPRRRRAELSAAKPPPALKDAKAWTKLKACDVIITCRAAAYTAEVYGRCAPPGWNGYWIDAAGASRMEDEAVIILDPVNMNVIKDSLAKGGKTFVGGNCTVSLMLMALGGLFQNDLVDWATSMTYQAASGAGANDICANCSRAWALSTPPSPELAGQNSAILDIDRKVAEFIRSDANRPNLWRAAGRQPDSVDRAEPGQRGRSRKNGKAAWKPTE